MPDKKKKPFVKIIILNWNGLADTIDCLDSLRLLKYKNFSITVIDNNSKNNEANQLSKRFGDFISVIKCQKNLGFVGGNNVAMKEISGTDYVLLLNNDTIVRPNFLEFLVKSAEADERIGIIGPIIIDYYNKTIQSSGSSINFFTGSTKLRCSGKKLGRTSGIKEVDMVSGCCMLIKKEVIKKVGILEEKYFAYYEETDYCARSKREGFIVAVDGRSVIEHKGQMTSKKIKGFHEFQMIRNRLIFVKKNADLFKWLTVILYVTFFYAPIRIVRLSISNQFGNIRYFIAGYIEGIRYMIVSH